MHFADFDEDAFLRDYWQKKPLLIRNPWADWHNPLEPDELAGLACEPHVEARLISQAERDYALEHGPLAEDRFDQLGQAVWTLLVQAVDHHIPAVAALLDPFRFIPNWRIDDIMVSYATDGGGVGAHFDQYDVFLIQGLGRRRWQLGGLCGDDTKLLPHDDLRLLAEFEPIEDWVLEPGDILYVPPRIAHRGVAVGHDCMTYSVGFRAPSRAELIEAFAQDLAEMASDADRYSDPDLSAQANAGEISQASLSRLHAMILDRLGDEKAFARWFGTFATSPKNEHIDWQPENPASLDAVSEALRSKPYLLRNPASRFAFIRQASESVLLMVDGECTECRGEVAGFAERLCASPRIKAGPEDAASQSVANLIQELINTGAIAFELEED